VDTLEEGRERDSLDMLARKALVCYGGGNWDFSFIRHNENLTYKAAGPDGQEYLLRLHLPAVQGFTGPAQDVAAIQSELIWLDALRNETGLLLQRPVPNLLSSPVTLLEYGSACIPATLMTWVDGSQVTWQEEDAEEITAEFAKVVSAFHGQSRRFRPPAGFVRPAYNKEKLTESLVVLAGGVDAGIITGNDYRMFEHAGAYICRAMDSAGYSRDGWGLIHSDWIGNLIRTGKSVTPIDFSLCGYGHYLLDLAICICNLNKPLRPVFTSCFGAEFSQGELRLMEAFTIYIITIAASRFIFTDLWGDWFTRRFPLIAREYCNRLINGQEFLFEI
jgi:Ser/Thr protein kinase RdoA (MazF antagonist)